MKTIGVTGGIGSGKTTVCRMLEDLGARVYDADLHARRIMESDAAVRRELVGLLGPEAYRADGRLDRAFIAGRVFRDHALLTRVNRVVHPRVRADFGRFRRNARGEGTRLVVKEAALLLEPGARRGLDALVAVVASESERVARARLRDGSNDEAVRARMAHQPRDEEFGARADHVIENTGSVDELRAKVLALWRALVGPDDPAP